MGESGAARTPVWLRPAGSALGRPASLSRDVITQSALKVADRDGPAGLTMRSVASELGTSAASLYRHVVNREELIDLMVDRVAGEYDLTHTTGAWLDDLVGFAQQGVEIHRRHRWLAEITETPVVGPNGLNVTEYVLAVLTDHPASDEQKLTAYAVLNALVTAYARHSSEMSPARAQAQATVTAHVLAQGKHPHLAALAPPSTGGSDDTFPAVVRGVLRGLLDPAVT